MSDRLYKRYDVDEETPVQFVGVYTTRWRPEWGEPTVMFREVDNDTQELADAAPALLSTCRAQHAGVEAMREWLNREQIDVPDDVLEALQEGRRQYKSVIAQVEGETP